MIIRVPSFNNLRIIAEEQGAVDPKIPDYVQINRRGEQDGAVSTV